MNEQILYILVGTPGSGKSTYVKNNLNNVRAYEADMYFMRTGTYQFDRNNLGHAHKWCQTQVMKELNRGNSCVVANTNLTPFELKPYFNMVRDCRENNLNVKIEIIECKFININDKQEPSLFNSIHFDNYSDEEKHDIAKNMLARNDITKRIKFYSINQDIINNIKLHTLYLNNDTYHTKLETFKI